MVRIGGQHLDPYLSRRVQDRDLADQGPGQAEDGRTRAADAEYPALYEVYRDRDTGMHEPPWRRAGLTRDVLRHRTADDDLRQLSTTPQSQGQEFAVPQRSPPQVGRRRHGGDRQPSQVWSGGFEVRGVNRGGLGNLLNAPSTSGLVAGRAFGGLPASGPPV